MNAPGGAGPSRRAFLGGALATVALGVWYPRDALRLPAAVRTREPFPPSVPLFRQGFVNWSNDIVIDDVPTCAPRTDREVLLVANWAARNGYRVRARGSMHTWAPLVIGPGDAPDRVVLLDTRQLAAVVVRAGAGTAVVTAQTGASLEAVLTALEQEGFGFVATPAPGDVTIGGVLAIDGHGTAVPAAGETRPAGGSFGSLSNLVVSLTAVVWDPGRNRFRLRTFERRDPAIRPLLTSLGRTILTEVTLQATRNVRLRCVSSLDVPARELFAAPGSRNARTFSSYLDRSGRVEAIWFPFTERPWLKVWSVAPRRPASTRTVDAPYNYPFAELDDAQGAALKASVIADPARARDLGALAASTVAAGLTATGATDLWGWSKNLLLYVRPNTLRYTANGYAIQTARRNVQRILHDFTAKYADLVARAAARGAYPASGPVEIRVTGLDRPMTELGRGADPPALSAVRPHPDHPEWDVAIWLDILSFSETPHAGELYREIERWLLRSQRRWSALVRPEWSKGWGYGRAGPWTDAEFVGHTVPASFRRGYPAGEDWDATTAALHALDPHRVFHTALLDRLMPRVH